MTGRANRLFIAVIVPFVALWAAAWFDGNVVADAYTQGGRSYDNTPATLATSFSYLIAMAGSIAVLAVAWRIRDRIVAVGYLIVGAFVLFDGFLFFKFAVSANGVSPAAPEPIARLLEQVLLSTAGRTNAALVVAAAMVLAGIGSLILARRERARPAAID